MPPLAAAFNHISEQVMLSGSMFSGDKVKHTFIHIQIIYIYIYINNNNNNNIYIYIYIYIYIQIYK